MELSRREALRASAILRDIFDPPSLPTSASRTHLYTPDQVRADLRPMFLHDAQQPSGALLRAFEDDLPPACRPLLLFLALGLVPPDELVQAAPTFTRNDPAFRDADLCRYLHLGNPAQLSGRNDLDPDVLLLYVGSTGRSVRRIDEHDVRLSLSFYKTLSRFFVQELVHLLRRALTANPPCAECDVARARLRPVPAGTARRE